MRRSGAVTSLAGHRREGVSSSAQEGLGPWAYQSIERAPSLTPTIVRRSFGVEFSASRSATSKFQEVHGCADGTNLVISSVPATQKMVDRAAQGRFGPPFRAIGIPIPMHRSRLPSHPRNPLVIKADEELPGGVAGVGNGHSGREPAISRPPMGSILYLTEVPPDGGGDTLFCQHVIAPTEDALGADQSRCCRGLTGRLHDSAKAHY